MTGEIDFDKLMEQQYEQRRPAMAGAQTRAEKRRREKNNVRVAEDEYIIDDPMRPIMRFEEIMTKK